MPDLGVRDLLSARGPGLGHLAEIIFGFRRSLNGSSQKLYRMFVFFSGSFSSFAKKKLFVIVTRVTQPGSGKRSRRLDIFEDFRSCHFPDTVRDNLQTSDPPSLCLSLNAKIISDILLASLNNPFKDY
jgi:hypothetical protein